MKNPFIVGKRIYLRPLELDDIERCVHWINNEEVNKFLVSGRLPIHKIKEETWIKNLYKDPNNILLAISLKEKDLHIGNTGLHNISWIDRYGILGIMIGEKKFWGKGYGTEATKLMLDYAFNRLNLERVELSVYEFNERAIKCYLKAGFKEEGRLRRRRFKDGRYWDEIVMGILKEEWIG